MESKRVFFVAHLCFADLAMSLPPEIPYTLCCYAYNCLELPGQLGKDLVRKASRQNSCWFKAVLQPLNGWIVQFEELSSTLLDENPSFNCRSAHSNGQLHVVFALPCSFLRCQGWCWTILVMLQQSSATGKHWWIPLPTLIIARVFGICGFVWCCSMCCHSSNSGCGGLVKIWKTQRRFLQAATNAGPRDEIRRIIGWMTKHLAEVQSHATYMYINISTYQHILSRISWSSNSFSHRMPPALCCDARLAGCQPVLQCFTHEWSHPSRWITRGRGKWMCCGHSTTLIPSASISIHQLPSS